MKMHLINEEEIKRMSKRIANKIICEITKEIKGSHVSHADFDKFSNNAFGSGEGKAPAHGYGTYVAIDPKGNPRYFLQSIRSDHFDFERHAQSYYYDIEIPDISDSNYIYEKYPISKIPNQINNIKKELLSNGINLESNEHYSTNMSCKNLLKLLGVILSGDKYSNYRTVENSPKSAASGLMAKCGIVGMLYYSKTENMCAVIFDPSQVKILKKTNMRSELGDIQPKDDNDRKRIQKMFTDSDFYKTRQKNFEENPFDTDKYYSFSKYVNKADDDAKKADIEKYEKNMKKSK